MILSVAMKSKLRKSCSGVLLVVGDFSNCEKQRLILGASVLIEEIPGWEVEMGAGGGTERHSDV